MLARPRLLFRASGASLAVDKALAILEAAAIISTAAASSASIEAKLTRAMRAAFLAQGTDFLRRFRSIKSVFESRTYVLPPNGEGYPLREAIRSDDWLPVWKETATETAASFETPIQAASEGALLAGAADQSINLRYAGSFDLEHPRAKAYLEDHAARQVTRINDETQRELRTILVRANDEGWSYQQAAKAIRDRFDGFAGKSPLKHIRDRAELVAVTEVGNAYEAGAEGIARTLQDGGLAIEKHWYDAGDARVHPGCRADTGAGWIGINDRFPSGASRPLDHPGCRCHCQYRRKRANRGITPPPIPDGTEPRPGPVPPPAAKARGPIKAVRPRRGSTRPVQVRPLGLPEEPPATLSASAQKAYRMARTGDRIAAWLENQLGMISRWSGDISIDAADSKYAGVKRWNCWIGLNVEYADRITYRFPTLIHEMVHSISKDLTPAGYVANKGWEEGLIELTARVHRKELMARQFPELALDEAVFAAQDYAYQIWVEDIQAIAKELKRPIKAFIKELLAMPVQERSAYVKALGEAKWKAGTFERNRWDIGFNRLDRELKAVDVPDKHITPGK